MDIHDTAEMLLLAIILLELEYGPKQWLENLLYVGSVFNTRSYWVYRTASSCGLLLVLNLIYRSSSLLFAITAVATLIGSSEVVIAHLQNRLYLKTGVRFRFLQTLVMVSLAVFAYMVTRSVDLLPSGITLSAWKWLSVMPVSTSLTQDHCILYLTGYVFLTHPTNYLIRWLFDKRDDTFLAETAAVAFGAPRLPAGTEAAIDRDEYMGEYETLRAGRVIGILERWILVTLVLASQYGALGLILTAKSIARFKKIQEDPAFAEYYLLGTLYSILAALFAGTMLSRL